MDTHLITSLDTRRIKKDCTYPIVLRLTHKKNSTSLPTGYSVEEKYFDASKRIIKVTCKKFTNVVFVNNMIDKQKTGYVDQIGRLKERKELHLLSLAELKKILLKKQTNSETVFNFVEGVIQDLKDKQMLGNARSYMNVLRAMKKFQRGKDLTFYDLNYRWILRFEKDYLQRGLSENGLAVYMRTIRAIFNKAIKTEMVEKEAYPFENYTIKTKPTKKRAISQEAIQKIVSNSDFKIFF